MKETQKMMEIINNQCRKRQEEEKIKKIKRIQKQKKEQLLWGSIILIVLLIIAVLIFTILIHETDKAMEVCMNNGYTQTYCSVHIKG